MEYIYAALLLHKAGKAIKEDDVKAVLTAAGIAVDESRVKALVAALEGIDIEDA
ncbi:MAG: 50S ribosomal protein L12, partial [Methanoregulaceae archaeon]